MNLDAKTMVRELRKSQVFSFPFISNLDGGGESCLVGQKAREGTENYYPWSNFTFEFPSFFDEDEKSAKGTIKRV